MAKQQKYIFSKRRHDNKHLLVPGQQSLALHTCYFWFLSHITDAGIEDSHIHSPFYPAFPKALFEGPFMFLVLGFSHLL